MKLMFLIPLQMPIFILYIDFLIVIIFVMAVCCWKLSICGFVILQIVSVDFSTSGGKARPRKVIKAVPGKGKKKGKAAKADK